ncbi:glycosyltransferase family 2 protein [Pontibacter silvestris]|uniref:Glycosyltransferase family 2 protein n=1 Tax=Pontibacter silvestris TaxID=2305183 RepID=A0ABW4WW80_9BACT|nr:glycosyltransferase family 2 protein [Pontibacter silvestris]MCC9136435.1 glycosyltransferase family 2 protein [Pontibacter silvestris]
MKVTCLIPCYNERERIAQVLEGILRVSYITQVLCVDDGSTDGTAAYIKKYWPAVQVLSLEHNQGKAAAIKCGLRAVNHELVLLMDADLQEIKQEEIEAAIEAFVQHQQSLDMLILRRINSPWFVKYYRSDILLSGERLIRKSDLEQILEQPVKGYLLEVAINRYMIRHRKVVRWMPWSAINTYKVEKWGVWGGSRREFRMYADIVYYVGFTHMIMQLTSFTRKLQPQTERQGL